MKRALITGAAGGLGKALAAQFDKRNVKLVLSDRNRSGLEALARDLTSTPELIVADLTSEHDILTLCERLENSEHPVDVLINNAGYGTPGPIDTLPLREIKDQLEICLSAPMLLSAAAAKGMKARGHGTIFFIGSLGGIFPMKDSAPYSAAKFGLRGFSAALSLELGEHGVYVGGIYPNAIDTPMLKEEMAHPHGSPLNFAGNVRPLSPEETAAAVFRGIEARRLETWLPLSDGFLAALVMAFPSLLFRIYRHLEAKGNRRKAQYLARQQI